MTQLWSSKCCTDTVSFLSPYATPWVCVLNFNADSWLLGITTQSIDFVGEWSWWEIVEFGSPSDRFFALDCSYCACSSSAGSTQSLIGSIVTGFSSNFSPKSIFLDSLMSYFASDRWGDSWTLSTGCWLKVLKTFFAFAPNFTTLFIGF